MDSAGDVRDRADGPASPLLRVATIKVAYATMGNQWVQRSTVLHSGCSDAQYFIEKGLDAMEVRENVHWQTFHWHVSLSLYRLSFH
jgi:hypothetical protein